MSEENVYKAPEAELIDSSQDTSKAKFFTTSQTKLIVLFIFTFGAYPIYWFYKNWKLQKVNLGEKVNPPLRSIFYVFFTHSLFGKVQDEAVKKNITMSWSSGALATIFVVMTIGSSIFDRFVAKIQTTGILDVINFSLVFVLMIPLIMVQKVVNQINGDPEGKLNSKFSIYNYIFILLGGIMWVFVLMTLFMTEEQLAKLIAGQQ